MGRLRDTTSLVAIETDAQARITACLQAELQSQKMDLLGYEHTKYPMVNLNKGGPIFERGQKILEANHAQKSDFENSG